MVTIEFAVLRYRNIRRSRLGILIRRDICLIIVVWLGEDWEEQILLHIIVRVCTLIGKILIITVCHALLSGIFLFVGSHKENGRPIEWRYLEHEMTMIPGLLYEPRTLPIFIYLCFKEHFLVYAAVAEICLPGSINFLFACLSGAIKINILSIILDCAFGTGAQALPHRVVCLGIHLVGHRGTIVYILHIFKFRHTHISHLKHVAIDSKCLFRSITQSLYTIISMPSLNHHQQVERLSVSGIVTGEIISGVSDESTKFTAQKKIGHHVSIIVSVVIGTRVAHADTEYMRSRHAVCRCDIHVHLVIRPEIGIVYRDLQFCGHVVIIDEEKT